MTISPSGNVKFSDLIKFSVRQWLACSCRVALPSAPWFPSLLSLLSSTISCHITNNGCLRRSHLSILMFLLLRNSGLFNEKGLLQSWECIVSQTYYCKHHIHRSVSLHKKKREVSERQREMEGGRGTEFPLCKGFALSHQKRHKVLDQVLKSTSRRALTQITLNVSNIFQHTIFQTHADKIMFV